MLLEQALVHWVLMMYCGKCSDTYLINFDEESILKISKVKSKWKMVEAWAL